MLAESKEPITDGEVTITSARGDSQTAKTDQNGEVHFTDVPTLDSPFKVKATKLGAKLLVGQTGTPPPPLEVEKDLSNADENVPIRLELACSTKWALTTVACGVFSILDAIPGINLASIGKLGKFFGKKVPITAMGYLMVLTDTTKSSGGDYPGGLTPGIGPHNSKFILFTGIGPQLSLDIGALLKPSNWNELWKNIRGLRARKIFTALSYGQINGLRRWVVNMAAGWAAIYKKIGGSRVSVSKPGSSEINADIPVVDADFAHSGAIEQLDVGFVYGNGWGRA